MEIVKELNLNKNPKQYKNNSMFFAKNVKLDENGTCIVRDNGIEEVKIIKDTLNGTSSLDTGSIIACFATINELIYFVKIERKMWDDDANNGEGGDVIVRCLRVYRYNEDTKKIIRYHTEITWNKDYQISFDYLYNNGNELIISFCLYEDIAKDNDITKLKSINLGEFSEMLSKSIVDDNNINAYDYTWGNDFDKNIQNVFNINHDIPFCQCKSEIIPSKNIICGVYQFFIRYEINTFGKSRDEYTKWFPIGKELYAVNLESMQAYDHYYGSHGVTLGSVLKNNINNKAFNSYQLQLNFVNNNFDISSFQIGYACKHEDSIDCRIWKSFKLQFKRQDAVTYTLQFDDNVLTNKNVVSIDDITDSVFNLYNVKNIINKNNRLYISNYKEDNVTDLSTYANNIKYNYNFEDNNVISYDESVAYIASILFKWRHSSADDDYEPLTIDKNTQTIYSRGDTFEIRNELENKFSNSSIVFKTEDGIELNTIRLQVTAFVPNTRLWYLRFVPEDDQTRTDFTIKLWDTDNNYLGDLTVQHMTMSKNVTVEDNSRLIMSGQNTLLPYTPYNFYVHYVKSDGTYTDGYPISEKDYESNKYVTNKDGNHFKVTPSGIKDNIEHKISVSFTVTDPIPPGYVGYFISYEKPEYILKYQAYVESVETAISGRTILYLNVTEVKLLLEHYQSKYIIFIQNNELHEYSIYDAEYNISDFASHTIGKQSIVRVVVNDADNPASEITQGSKIFLSNHSIKNNNSNNIEIDDIYTYKVKTLIRLTDVITSTITPTNGIISEDICDFNYDSFYAFVNDFVFKTNIFISDDGQVYYMSSNSIKLKEYEDFQYVDILKFSKYSKYNLSAINYKTNPTNKIAVPNNGTDKYLSIYYAPSDLTDLFQLQSCYVNKNNIKTYLNYINRPGTSTIFDNTIRRSDVYGDEAYSNAWKNFRAAQYKTILNKKGKITKLVSLSNNIIIHKEGSLFILDADNKLQAINRNVNLASIDMFELDAKEITDSDNGRCGLSKKNHSIVTDVGYVFYSESDKKIYSYTGKLAILSQPLDYILKNITIDDCNFAFDIEENRIFVCITTNINTITLSYNIITSSFVSLHDMFFVNAVTTNKNLYYLHDNIVYKPTKDREVNTYNSLELGEDNLFWMERVNDKAYRIIDIVCNYDYEKIKQLESIVYSLYQLGAFVPSKYQANNVDTIPYPGYKILIYSDDCATEENDISDMTNGKELETGTRPNNKLDIDSYKYPTLDRGMWHYNYFRNIKSDVVVNGKLHTDEKNNGGHTLHVDANALYGYSSDNNSLIYGKYIVIRFIIPNNVNFRLETLQFNIN